MYGTIYAIWWVPKLIKLKHLDLNSIQVYNLSQSLTQPEHAQPKSHFWWGQIPWVWLIRLAPSCTHGLHYSFYQPLLIILVLKMCNPLLVEVICNDVAPKSHNESGFSFCTRYSRYSENWNDQLYSGVDISNLQQVAGKQNDNTEERKLHQSFSLKRKIEKVNNQRSNEEDFSTIEISFIYATAYIVDWVESFGV